MGQTRMFRDRVVSMEQTLEGGEKHLDLLRGICLEAYPDHAYRSHALDHERDLFVMQLEAPDGRRKSVAWTRMALFDVERIPAIAADPQGALRAKVVAFLRERAGRPDVMVTFRHLEEGWTDTPEPRPSRRRRRRGGGRAGGRPPERARESRPPGPRPAGPSRPPGPPGPRPAPPVPAGKPAEAGPGGGPRPPGARRRSRRRRRGRGGAPGSPSGAPRTP